MLRSLDMVTVVAVVSKVEATSAEKSGRGDGGRSSQQGGGNQCWSKKKSRRGGGAWSQRPARWRQPALVEEEEV